MGLSIHYSGTFNPSASLQEMIDEVRDVAEIFNWTYCVHETQFPQLPFESVYDGKICGIEFTPPECETTSLCFLSNGRISCPARLCYFGKGSESGNESYLYVVSVKTQFAGAQLHVLLMKLLKHLSMKYLTDFKLSDEGKYWETEDEGLLNQKFAQYNSLLDDVSEALTKFPTMKGETMEAYLTRILKHGKKR